MISKQTVSKTKISLNILSLMNKYVFKSFIGIIVGIGGSFLFMIVFFLFAYTKEAPNIYINTLAGVLGMCILPFSLLTIPALNIEFRRSIIMRKIKIANVSRIHFILLQLIYFFVFELVMSGIIFLIFFLFCLNDKVYYYGLTGYHGTMLDIIKYCDFGSIFYSWMMLIISSISFGLFLSTLYNNLAKSQLLGLLLLFLTIVLGAQVISISEWADAPFLKYMSLFSPLSYPLNAMNCSTMYLTFPKEFAMFNIDQVVFSSAFNWKTNLIYFEVKNKSFAIKTIMESGFKTVFTLAPILFITIFSSLAIKLFKYNSR